MPKQLTNQRLVTYVVRALKAQGAPGRDAFGQCLNLTRDGKRCGIAICFKKESSWHANATLQKALIHMGASGAVVKAIQLSHDSAARYRRLEFIDTFRLLLKQHLGGMGFGDLKV